MVNDNLLEINKLSVTFRTQEGLVKALEEMSLCLKRGQTLGIAGESGCGKSITSQAILRLIPKNGFINHGSILYYPKDRDPIDITKLKSNSKQIRTIRGKEISIIFQEPMTSFSPVLTIGKQIDEIIILHQKVDKKTAKTKSIEMLKQVGLPNADSIHASYAYNLSGGMRQRAMIAMALSCQPDLLIADEPTTAIDVTTQAMVLKLIRNIQRENNLSLIFITHDLAILSELADDILIMYMGKEVEYGPIKKIYKNPLHPYTMGLLFSIPILGKGREQNLSSIPGSVPNPYELPNGCLFHPRCEQKILGLCEKEKPPLYHLDEDRSVRCFLYKDR